MLEFVVAVLLFGVVIGIANWPLAAAQTSSLSKIDRNRLVAHNRRHHRRILMAALVILTVNFGVIGASMIAGPPKDRLMGLVFAVLSLGCLVLFAVIIGRRRIAGKGRRAVDGRS